MRPESRGSITLNSNDPYEYPIIHANYFDAQIDLDTIVRKLKNMTFHNWLKLMIIQN